MDPSRTCRSCGGAQGDHLGAQVAFVFAILAWVLPLSFIMFFSLNAMDMLRVPKEVELEGLDAHEHGGVAYELDRGTELDRTMTPRKSAAPSTPVPSKELTLSLEPLEEP